MSTTMQIFKKRVEGLPHGAAARTPKEERPHRHPQTTPKILQLSSQPRDRTPETRKSPERIATPGRDWLPQMRNRTPSPPPQALRTPPRVLSDPIPKRRKVTFSDCTNTCKRESKRSTPFVKSKIVKPIVQKENKLCKRSQNFLSHEQNYIIDYVKHFFGKPTKHVLYSDQEAHSFHKCHCIGQSSNPTSLKLRDADSGWNFLVDTGACKSFVPPPRKMPQRLSPYEGGLIITANGQSLKIYGTKRIHIVIANKKYTWDFIVADVTLPILGADFLAAHKLAVDIAGQRLIPIAHLNMVTSEKENPIPEIISRVIENFKDIFSTDLAVRNKMASAHSAVHTITTTSPPLRSKFRRLSPDKLEIAKHVFAELEQAGICQKAASPWASPLHMVKKADGSFRPCGDYRRLNTVTVPDHYPLPNITDITNVLGGAKVFSKIDLTKGYHQVPIAKEDIPKTAICTPFGTYTFNYTCFGLRNAGATFQRLMDEIFAHLPCIVVYIDDLLIFSPNMEQHAKDIAAVLQILKENGLIIRPDKCIWAKSAIEFLGHNITNKGVLPLQKKVTAIENYPRPTTVKELMAFNGMVNYYHRFIPNLAKIMSPLYEALKDKPKKLEWSRSLQESFEETKKALTKSTLLSYPRANINLVLTTDASDVAIGGVLEQELPNGKQPIGFFSRKLSNTEKGYCTLDKELLALHRAIRHFHHLLDERQFIARTDHMPLVHAFVAKKDAWSPRVRRQLSEISEYQCAMEYIKGPDNYIADTLSRQVAPLIHLGIDYAQIQHAQINSHELQDIQANSPSLKWQDFKFGDYTITCDVSTGRPRPYIPTTLRKSIFNLTHGISHPSANSTSRLIATRYLWSGMKRDIKQWVRECPNCQLCKTTTHVESGIQPYDTEKRRFASIHLDIVGPLPPSEGYKYILTIIDRATRWTEAYPLRTQTAEACLRPVIDWISRYGLPEAMITDQGTNFTSDLWREVTEKIGVKLQHVTAYNPEANGIIERFHRTLKTALTASSLEANWSRKLPWVMLALRSTPHAALGSAPSEAVFGKSLRIPADILPTPDPPATIKEVSKITESFLPPKQTYSTALRKIRMPPQLGSCPFVYERIDCHKPPLSPSYAGPYPVLRRESKAYLLNKHSKESWVSIDRLKPAFLAEEHS